MRHTLCVGKSQAVHWTFFPESCLSIVDKGGDGTTLLVRRVAGDIERTFLEALVVVSAGTEYHCRESAWPGCRVAGLPTVYAALF
ncbi:hypothetical protein AWB81_06574 [Caballeronia arationis]|nr:hypothetical protein AWB81_06574 [Caballeronia arationis]